MKRYEIIGAALVRLGAHGHSHKGAYGCPGGSGGRMSPARIDQIKGKNGGNIPLEPGKASAESERNIQGLEKEWGSRDKWTDEQRAMVHDYHRGLLTQDEFEKETGKRIGPEEGTFQGVKLPATGVQRVGGKTTETYPRTEMSQEELKNFARGNPERKAEETMYHAYMSRTSAEAAGATAARLQRINETEDYPARDALNKEWLRVLNSPQAQLPSEVAINLFKAFGYAPAAQIKPSDRKQYGS